MMLTLTAHAQGMTSFWITHDMIFPSDSWWFFNLPAYFWYGLTQQMVTRSLIRRKGRHVFPILILNAECFLLQAPSETWRVKTEGLQLKLFTKEHPWPDDKHIHSEGYISPYNKKNSDGSIMFVSNLAVNKFMKCLPAHAEALTWPDTTLQHASWRNQISGHW